MTPQCELHRRCGGCQIQALDYEKHLEFKQNKVRGNLIRIGGFAPELIDRIMLPVVGMKEPYRYRNKAQFPIGADKDENPVAGFYAARTHSIIPVNDCKLGVEENQIILNEVLSYMKEYHVASYDENTGKGLVRHVLIRYGFSTKELMVCVIINGNSLPKVKTDRQIDSHQNEEHFHQSEYEENKCDPRGCDEMYLGRSIHYRYDPSTRYEGFFTD